MNRAAHTKGSDSTRQGLPAREVPADDRPTAAELAADLMTRMGHDSPRAALIYQHRTAGGDRAIADAMDAAARQQR